MAEQVYNRNQQLYSMPWIMTSFSEIATYASQNQQSGTDGRGDRPLGKQRHTHTKKTKAMCTYNKSQKKRNQVER